jgi:hypothetical protein
VSVVNVVNGVASCPKLQLMLGKDEVCLLRDEHISCVHIKSQTRLPQDNVSEECLSEGRSGETDAVAAR